MQQKGIIMQLGDRYAVVMTREAQFVKIPLVQGMEIGQEVDVPAQAVQPAGKKSRIWFNSRFKQTGVLAATFLMAAGIWSYQQMNQLPAAYAYVTVDINPSIELAVDNQQTVVAVTPLNSDGETVIDGTDVEGMPVQEAVGTLTQVAQSKGYLQDQADVLVTASLADQSDDQAAAGALDLDVLEENLVQKIKTVATTNGQQVEVEGILVSKEVRTAAQEAGVSPGKYAFYLSAQSQGYDVELDELKNNSIHKVMSERGTELADVVHDLNGEQLDELLTTLKEEGKSALQQKAKAVMPAESKQDPPGQVKKQDKKNTTPAVKDQSNAPGNDKKNDNNKNNSNKNNGKNEKDNKGGADKKEPSNTNSSNSSTSAGQDNKVVQGRDDKGNSHGLSLSFPMNGQAKDNGKKNEEKENNNKEKDKKEK